MQSEVFQLWPVLLLLLYVVINVYVAPYEFLFHPAGTLKQWSQLEGPAFEFQPAVFLYGVCMFSLCLRGFVS